MRIALVGAAIGAGAALRLVGWNNLGLSHFDEGQYAFAQVWPWSDGFVPAQAFFSPPLFPFLVGLIQSIGLVAPDRAGPVVALIFDICSILLAARVAARWFAPAAGPIAAWLLALDPLHRLFATAGLTDAPFAFLFLLALHCAGRAVREGGFARVLLAGIACGFTWSCKYNGFLPALLAFAFIDVREPRRGLLRAVAIAGIAAAMMAPWFSLVETRVPGGLAALRAHQRGYLRGPGAILDNEKQAIAQAAGLADLPRPFGELWTAAILLAPVAVLLRPEFAGRFGWFVAWAALMVLPGIYTPYLRLWLPTQSVCIVLAAAATALLPSTLRGGRAAAFGAALGWGMASAAALALVAGPARYRYDVAPKHGYRPIADAVAAQLKGDEARVVFTLVRPPLLLYLAGARKADLELRRLGDAATVETLPAGAALLVDRAMADNPEFAAAIEKRRAAGRLEETRRFPIQPGTVTRLDDGQTGFEPDLSAYDVILYRIR